MILPVAYQRMIQWSNKHDAKKGMPLIWQENAVKNIAYFDANPDKVIGSVHDLPRYEGKAAVFIGRGPSLKKAIGMFGGIDDRFILICTNSSLRYLLDHGIVPHYMVCIDGEKGAWTFDNLPDNAAGITALFAAGAYHEEVVKWPGKIMVLPYGVKKGSVQKEIKRRWGKPLPAGGNAMNGAIAAFLMKTLVKIYVFVGNNLSFKEGEQFYFDQKTDRDDRAYYIAKDIYGEECYTDLPMFQYKAWLEQAASQFWPECYFVNCSEGILGVDTDGKPLPLFDHMPLDMAIDRIKEALDFENQPTIDRYKGFYQLMYDKGFYEPHNGKGVWDSVEKAMQAGDLRKFTKGLDVGCGLGEGIRDMRAKGYDVYGVDIADIKRYWQENGVADVCKQAPAHKIPYHDNTFDFVMCGDVMEHIPEEYILPTLKEILRVGSKDFFFFICCHQEAVPPSDRVRSHVTLNDPDEWVSKFKDVGYEIERAERHPSGHVLIVARKDVH